MKLTDDMKQRAKDAYNARAESEAEDYCYTVALDEALAAALNGYELAFELEPAEKLALKVASGIAERGESVGANTSTVLIWALERAQRTLTRLELAPAEPQPDAPTDIAALPDYWDERRRRQGKNDKSRCAAELRIALAKQPALSLADSQVREIADAVGLGFGQVRYELRAAIERVLGHGEPHLFIAKDGKAEWRNSEPDPAAYSDAQVRAAWEAYESSLCKRPADRNSALREALAAAGVPPVRDHFEVCRKLEAAEERIAEIEAQLSDKSDEALMCQDACGHVRAAEDGFRERIAELEAQLAEARKPRVITDADVEQVCKDYFGAHWTYANLDTMRAALEALALPAAPAQRFELTAEERTARGVVLGYHKPGSNEAILVAALDRALSSPAPEQPADGRVLVARDELIAKMDRVYSERKRAGQKLFTNYGWIDLLVDVFPAPATPAPESVDDVIAAWKDDRLNAVQVKADHWIERLEAARKREVGRG